MRPPQELIEGFWRLPDDAEAQHRYT